MRWMFLGDFEEHCIREIFLGAAGYVATRPGVVLNPWSTFPGRGTQPTLADLHSVDGLLLAEAELGLLGGRDERLHRPHVVFFPDAGRRDIPTVTLDHAAVGRMAAEHLIQRGYRHLAFLGLPATPWSQARGEGFRAAAGAQGLTVRSHDVLPSALQVLRPPRLGKPGHAMHHVLETLPTPCGIFAVCDIGACYLVRAAIESGFRIPEQFGVVGVDDDPVAGAAAGLAISSVQVPYREGGWRAAALLDKIAGGKRPPNPPPLAPVRVVVRTSTNAFRVVDPLLRRALELIETRRAGGFRVDEVVRALHTTKVTLGQRFREHFRMTPAKYILHRRIEYAKELLRAGELSVQQVSEACHFSKSSYFSRIFKRATGVSPGALRPAR